MSFCLACLAILLPQIALTQVDDGTIDPRLQEFVQIVRARVEAPDISNLNRSSSLEQNEVNLNLVTGLQAASYSRVPQTILDSVAEFHETYKVDGGLTLDRIASLYTDYAHGLEQSLSSKDLQLSLIHI